MIIGLETASFICGWGYVICWGISLYPPILLNYSNKSVEGISIDFAYLNFWGCVSYMLSISMMYFSTTVRLEYALAHAGEARRIGASPKQPLVRLNDVIYGAHSLTLICILLIQFYFCGYRKLAYQRLSKTVKIFSLCGVLGGLLLVLHAYEINTTRRHYQLVDVANIFGNAKVLLSSIKYIPQVYFNYQRQSVRGFAIKGCVTDIIGGILCSLQLIIDAVIVDDIYAVYRHPTKLLLALVSMFFGIVFLVQSKLYSKTDDEPTVYNKRSSKFT